MMMQEVEDAYEKWEEAERKHAHIMGVYKIIDTLGDTESDHNELEYQKKRLKFSPAYFSGHPAYCGERLNPRRRFDEKQYESAIQWLMVCGLLKVCVG